MVEYFKPQRVILFGSRARGETTRDSDIDLLVVVDDDTPPEKLTWKARYEAQRSYRAAADVFPMRAEAFERERTVVGTVAAEADADGIVLYGTPKGLCMKPPDTRARWEAVDDWLAVANDDRRVTASCLAMDPPLRGVAAFHCQQAVERLLKGFLTLAGKRSRKTHARRGGGGELSQNSRARGGCEGLEQLGCRLPLSTPAGPRQAAAG